MLAEAKRKILFRSDESVSDFKYPVKEIYQVEQNSTDNRFDQSVIMMFY